MAGALVAVTLGTAVGGLVSDNQILHVAIGGCAGLLCGLAGTASVPSMTAGVLGLVVFTIFSGSPIDLLDWKTNALLMMLGAAIMSFTVVAEFAVRTLVGRKPTLKGEMADANYWTRARVHLHWSDQFILHSIRLGIVITIAAYVVLAFLAPNYGIAVADITVFVFFLFHTLATRWTAYHRHELPRPSSQRPLF